VRRVCDEPVRRVVKVSGGHDCYMTVRMRSIVRYALWFKGDARTRSESTTRKGGGAELIRSAGPEREARGLGPGSSAASEREARGRVSKKQTRAAVSLSTKREMMDTSMQVKHDEELSLYA
jgi:hypothetical protein